MKKTLFLLCFFPIMLASCSQSAKFDKAEKKILSSGGEIIDSNSNDGYFLYLQDETLYYWNCLSQNEPHLVYSEDIEMKYCPLNYSESSKKYEILELRTDEYDCDYGPYDLETFFHSVEITKKADGSISGFSFYEPYEETFYFVPFDKKIIYSSNGYRLNQDYYATDEIFVADCFPDVARSLPYSDYFDDIAYFSIPISFEKGVMSPKNGKPLIVICGNAYEFDLQQPYSQLNPQVYKALYSYILENEAVYESDLQWAVIDNPIKARDMLVGEYRYVRTSFPNSIDYTDYVRWARRDYGYEYCLHKLTLENGENYEKDFDAFYYTDDPGFLNIDYPTREILVITKIASLEKTEGHFVNTVYIPSSYK